MDEKEFWELAFITVCSMRFHPRNDDNNTWQRETALAASVADEMLKLRKQRWPQ